MFFRLRGWLHLVGWIVLALAVGSTTAQAPAPGDSKTPAVKTPAVKGETARPAMIDELPLPPGAILVLIDDARKALGLVDGVWLSAKRYQELMRLEQEKNAKKPAEPAKPESPTSCKITGRVDGDLVRITVRFEFQARQAKTLVALGCQRAWPTSARIDGNHLPVLLTTDDGLLAQVDATGPHELTLDLEMPLVSRGTKGSERGFDLGLPRASITLLEQFSLPDGIAEARVNGKSVAARPMDGRHHRIDAAPALGPSDHLELFWKAPAPASTREQPLLAAEGRLVVRLEEARTSADAEHHTRVTTDVELNLHALRGEVKQWRILLPEQVAPEVKEPGPQDERIESIEPPGPKDPCLTIKLKAPTSDPLRVVFQLTQARKGTLVPVGPVSVVGAFRQRGTIVVSAPPDLRLHYLPRGDVSQREVTDDLRRDNAVAAFSYWNLPLVVNPAKPPPAPLDLEIETIKGAVETRVEHGLLVTESGCQVVTRVDVVPHRMGVERLELQIPADYPFDETKGASPADLVEDVVIDAKKRIVQVKLAQKQFRPFSVSLPASYPLIPGAHAAALDLPRPLQTLDRGAQMTVTVPDGMELLGRELGGALLPRGSRKHTWKLDAAPARVEASWREYRPDLTARVDMDVTLAEERAWVRQQVHLQFPDASGSQVALEIPVSLADLVRVVEGGILGPGGVVRLDRPDQRAAITLQYSFALPEFVAEPEASGKKGGAVRGRLIAMLFVRIAAATHVETKVRVWCDPTFRLKMTDLGWNVQRTETTPDRDSLPVLVLSSSNKDCRLSLQEYGYPDPNLVPAGDNPFPVPLASVVVDHALIQAVVGEDGAQSYRARFLLGRLGTRHLDIEFPVALSGLNLEVLLDGKKTPLAQLPDDDGDVVLRLNVEPDLYRKPVLLDVRYDLAPGRTKGTGSLHCVLYPPVLRGDVILRQVRWQVGVPAGWMCLYDSGGFSAEQRWEWRGGLLIPVPVAGSADLERELAGKQTLPNGGTPLEGVDNGLVCRRPMLGPLRFLHVPVQVWQIVCSLLLLLAGFGLTYAVVTRGRSWWTWMALDAAILVAACGYLYLSIWWPSVLNAVILGCEPGLAVFLTVLLAQGLLHLRYRRRMIFLPGFTRLKPGSTVARASGIRKRSEPSTIDAPRMKDGSVR